MTVPPQPCEATDLDVLHRAAAEAAAGGDVVLVTLVSVEGSAFRVPGAMMLVRGDGTWLGQITGGCLEAAVALEARAALREGRCRVLRYGLGSPFIDIRLPCGGGIDLHLDVRPDPGVLGHTIRHLHARTPFAFAFDPRAPHADRQIASADTPAVAPFSHRIDPPLRVVVAGRGAELLAVVRQARGAGYMVIAPCVDHEERAAYAALGADARMWSQPDALSACVLDARTAVVSVLHDPDWEDGLLAWALPSTAFHVSAIGGARTREARLAGLADRVPAGGVRAATGASRPRAVLSRRTQPCDVDAR